MSDFPYGSEARWEPYPGDGRVCCRCHQYHSVGQRERPRYVGTARPRFLCHRCYRIIFPVSGRQP